MIFQPFFATLVAGAMFWFLVRARRSAVQRLFVAAAFGTGLVLVLWPDLSTALAHAVGIGRGVDLITYVSILFLFCVSLNFYARFKDLEDWQVQVVRRLALEHPVRVAPPRAESTEHRG